MFGTAKPPAEVVRFPPLPPVPEPPRSGEDPRQRTFRSVVGGLAGGLVGAAGDEFRFSVANTESGYPASALDLGRLQEALGSGLAAFDMDRIRERWDVDVFQWLRRTIFRWVSRCKLLTLKPEEDWVRIEIETKDDLGYYEYAFHVFPGRKTPPNSQREER